MDSNTFLLLFGLDPSQFERIGVVVESLDGGGWALSAKQRQDERECPICRKSSSCVVHDHYVQKIRARMPDGSMGTIAATRPKFSCSACGKHFTMPLKGVGKGDSISQSIKASIKADLRKMRTFAQIAADYGVAPSRVVSLFDEMYPEVPKLPLPEALCIDEILFS